MRDPLVVVAMLRFIVLFALVAGSIHAAPCKQSFTQSKTTIYQYNFQHVFADPRNSRFFSILNAESTALLISEYPQHLTLKLQDISIGSLETKINEPNPLLRMVTKEVSPGILNEKIKEIIKKLELPVRFDIANGVISNLTHNEKDVVESVNIKRGLLSLFEINNVELNSAQPKSTTKVYLEKNVQGLCKTSYVVENVTSSIISAVKTIHTDECIILPKAHRGLIFTPRGLDCEPRVKLVETATTVRYNITKKNTVLLIQEVISESNYNLLFNSPSEGRITLSLNQTLRMKKMVDPKSDPRSSNIYARLIAEIPVKKTAPFKQEKVTDKIIAALNGEIQAKKVNEIIMLLEFLDLQNLEKIWRSLTTRQQLVVDIFTKVDSPAMKEFLVKELPVIMQSPIRTLTDIALFQSPDDALLLKLMEVIKTGRINPLKRKHLILNIGAYAHKWSLLVQKMEKEILQGDILIAQADKDMVMYQDKLKDVKTLWNEEKSNKLKVKREAIKKLDDVTKFLKENSETPIYNIKALGNMGYNKTVDTILAIITNITQPEELRILAVDALRKMPVLVFAEKIQMPLLKLYTSMNETSELRTRAFLLMTGYNLQETTILALLLTHQTEIPDFVGAFVFKYLSELARSQFFPLLKMSAKAKKVVTAVDPILPMVLKEKITLASVYEESHTLWHRLSSLLVWHVSVKNDLALSSAALDLQIIPGVTVPRTSVIARARVSSVATYEDIGLELVLPVTVQQLYRIIKMGRWSVLTKSTLTLKRNDLDLISLKLSNIGHLELCDILTLVWNANKRIVPTSSGGFLKIDQKSTVIVNHLRNIDDMTVTSECKTETYIDGYYLQVGAGKKTATKWELPGKIMARIEHGRLVMNLTVKALSDTVNLVLLEQVPFTMIRIFLPSYNLGEEVITYEAPVIISEPAIDVNYIQKIGKCVMRAQLPMKPTGIQEILTAVWYGTHSIKLYCQDISPKMMTVELAGGIIKETSKVIVKTSIKIDQNVINKTSILTIVPDSTKLIAKIDMKVDVNGLRETVQGEISLPHRQPIPARCLFSARYQNTTRDLLRKVDISQPCLIRSQIETINPKILRIWKRLISLGLLDFDENDHNLVAQVDPTMITKPIKTILVEHLFRQIKLSKKIKAFNEAAFHPLHINSNYTIIPLHAELVDSITAINKSIDQLSINPDDLVKSTYNFGIVLQILSIQEVNIRIFREALHKISYVNPTINQLIHYNPIPVIFRHLVRRFNRLTDPAIERILVTENDKQLFNKIKEVEKLLLDNTTKGDIIQLKVVELLSLLPESFDLESVVTEVLFLRAQHLVSASIVFQTGLKNVSKDAVYEFWHLRQVIVLYLNLKQEIIDAIPCKGHSYKEICKILVLFKQEFTLFHRALSYKRVAVRYFNTRSADYSSINKLMLEFDNLLKIIRDVSSDLISTAIEKPNLMANSSVAIIRGWNRLTSIIELSVKLLEEYQSIWENIKVYGMSGRSIMLDDMKRKITIMWNKLKIKESCKSRIVSIPEIKPDLAPRECELPETLKVTVKVVINSNIRLYAQLTAKKSLEQLIYDHHQNLPGFRSETSYRYLEQLGLRLSRTFEQFSILQNINVYQDIQIDAHIANTSPMAREIVCPYEKLMTRSLRWCLYDYWQIEDLKTAHKRVEIRDLKSMGPRATIRRLPTIRIIQYMDRQTADILIVRPSLTESLLAVPALYVPVMYLPFGGVTPLPTVTVPTEATTTVISTTVPTETTTPVEGSTTVPTETTTPVEGSTTVPTETTTPVESSTIVTTEATTPVEGSTTVTTEATTPVEGSTTVTTEATTPVEGSTTVTKEPKVTIKPCVS
uniref:Vitellogenin1 n=1 Tax=Uroteuthis edulis TaxID=55720 RepID=A0A1L7MRT2_9MOLL|nr:vitellogenin1 [Uroteuthis edulis]